MWDFNSFIILIYAMSHIVWFLFLTSDDQKDEEEVEEGAEQTASIEPAEEEEVSSKKSVSVKWYSTCFLQQQ